MITLKAPVELKTRTDFVRDHEGFGERIAANYTLMGLEIGAEELLHIAAFPPEIYLAEGDSTTIVGNTMIESRNEEKLNVINNMLNRIMLSVNAELSYQDRAYITDTLYKLGIKDDRKFMHEVRQMMNESRREEDFISSYLNMSFDRDNAALRHKTLELSREVLRNESRELIREREDHLSRSIMQRLKTGAIYQIVANFNKSLNETRIELAEQLLSEQENTAKSILVRSFLSSMEREGTELIYREEEGKTESPDMQQGAYDRLKETYDESRIIRETDRTDNLMSTIRERSDSTRSETREAYETELIYREEAGDTESSDMQQEAYDRLIETRDESRTIRERSDTENLMSTIRELSESTSSATYEREGAEIVYRDQASAPDEAEQQTLREIGVSRYVSSNIYERELSSDRVKESEVTNTIGAAVLLDVIKNLYHAGFERINKSDAWIEYRGALYHSSENTINRVSTTSYDTSYTGIDEINTADNRISLDYAEFEELSEIQENEGNIELIENEIREMNELNLENVSRYEQMREILKKLQPERRLTGGRERTRREALTAIEDEKAILESLDASEGNEESVRREVFHEITRLFPDSAAQVFNVVEQYLDNPGAVQGVSVTSGNVAQAAEELMRLTQANENISHQEERDTVRAPEGELVFKREERLTEDELTEILDTYRRSGIRQHRDTEDTLDVTDVRRVNTTTVTQNTERNLSERELQDIEEMVNKGVRSQMGAISEQVLTKLEKRLRNEKSRRGI